MKKVLFLIGMICIFLLNGCNIKNTLEYSNAEKYHTGGSATSATIKKLEIEWIAGYVVILCHNEDYILFDENPSLLGGSIADEDALKYYLEDDVLYIKFSRAGVLLDNCEPKNLFVYLPSDFVLDKLEINTISSGIDIEGVNINESDIDTVSGDVYLSWSNLHSIDIETVSGDCSCSYSDGINRLSIESVSGNIELIRLKELNTLEIESTSGDVNLKILDESFTLKFKTVSGKFSSEIEVVQKDDKYVYNMGNHSYQIETISGDVNIVRYI